MGKCILGGHPPVGGQIGYGTYTGNGAASQFISLGVTPKWVLVLEDGYATGIWNVSGLMAIAGGLAISGKPASAPSYGTSVSIASNGFQVYYDTQNYRVQANTSSTSYSYIYGT